MKQTEITRVVKSELWRLFDAGHADGSAAIAALNLPSEAVEKQRRLHAEFRVRNPKPNR